MINDPFILIARQRTGQRSFSLSRSQYMSFLKHTFFISTGYISSKLLILSFLILLILTSCNTLSPASSVSGKAIVFASVEAVEPVWLPYAQGIGFFHGKAASPGIEFYALKIDLASPDTRVIVKSGKMSDNGIALSAKVTSFTRDNNLLAGINAVPFDIVSSKEGKPIQNMGIVISDGEILAPVNPRYDALVFYKNNNPRAAIVSQADIHVTENIENAAGGFYQILADAQLTQRTLISEARHPRSGAGISPNGEYLYLLVIDGRRRGSIGATEMETALLLRSLGCRDAVNFDGGGSSALALRRPDGSVKTVNIPIHGGIAGRERAVAGCLGISISTEK